MNSPDQPLISSDHPHDHAHDPASHPHDDGHGHHHLVSLTWREKVINFLGVVIPFIGIFLAIVFLWGRGFSWLQLGLLLAMYTLSGLGITIGYHRLFTHGSFKTYAPVKAILAILGSMAVEGPVLKWVAQHRRHHQHSDADHDPHSPHHHGGGFLGIVKGFFHAHVGWIFQPDSPTLHRYVGDLRKDTVIRRISATFPLWASLGLLIPTILGGLISMSWMGAWLGFIWGGLVRIFLVHHITWSINSVCHIWGTRPFKSDDESRNNVIFGVIGFGEGWHNNHHAFPTSARHGLRWWQIDTSYWVIRVMAWLGLAWDVRVPGPQQQQQKLAKPA